MAKHVILTLEYSLGDYSDYIEDLKEEGQELNLDPKYIGWTESFYQSDVFTSDMEIIGVRIEEK